MGDVFYRDSFSHPFTILKYFGNWPIDSISPVKKKLYLFYRIIAAFYEWHLVIIGWIDLYLSLNNFERIVYNLCITIFTTTLTVKNLYFILNANRVNKFRQKLNLYSSTEDDEATKTLNKYRYYLRVLTIMFYISASLFAPIWLLSSLISLKLGIRELPFPLWLPLELEDNYQYSFGFFYHAVAALVFIGRAIHAELAIFSLILQTTGLYKVLGQDLMKINDFYDGDGGRKTEINKHLTRARVKKELRNLLRRQLEMKECVKEVEYVLHLPILFELFGGLLLSVINGFQVIEVTMNYSFKLSYQIAYTIIVLTDLFMWCLLSDHLMEASTEINSVLYNLTWYEMENDIRKDVLLMIMSSQRIQRLTVGKFFTLNLATYLGVIKNLYSWLTVFRTVTQKK